MLKRLTGERSRRERLIASFHMDGHCIFSGIGRAIGMARIKLWVQVKDRHSQQGLIDKRRRRTS
jgi:hypothetical protein